MFFTFNLNKTCEQRYIHLKGDKAIIKDFDIDIIPLKLLEMGCLPGNTVELLQIAPLEIPYI
jgi:Fe2+ transport system protein FeoA